MSIRINIYRPKLGTRIYGTAWCKDYGRSGRGFSTRRKGYRWSPIGTVARTTRYQREGSCRRDQQKDRLIQWNAGPGQDCSRRKEELHRHGGYTAHYGAH